MNAPDASAPGPRPPSFGQALVAVLDDSDTTSLWFFDDRGRIRWASNGALRRRGWTLDGVVGRTMAEVFDADYRFDIADLIRRGLDAPSSTTIGGTPEERRTLVAFPVDDGGARCVGLVSTRHEAALQRLAETAADTELHRVTSDLHDGPIQDITAASIYLSLIEARIAESGGDPEIARMVQRTGEVLLRATTDLRNILDELFTLADDVDAAGFESEIAALADDVARQTGAEVTAVFDFGGHETFRADLLPTMHRVTAEALRNAAKHAEAAHVSIDVRVESSALVTRIVDDGRGFDLTADRAPGHFGLSLMDRRCRAAGGSVDVASSPGAGTAVSIRLPLLL